MDMPESAATAGSATASTLTQKDKLSIILGVLATMFLAALDQTIVAPAMPTIGATLGDTQYLPWIISAYLLTGTASAPLYGKISDIYGRRPVMLAAVLIFIAGSIGAALAPDMPSLIAARAVQGVGGGGLFVLAQTIIGDTVAPRERALYAGYISGTWAIASIAGPLLGGLFAQHLSWKLIFWINLPLGAAALAILLGPLRKLPRSRRSHRLDFLGGALVLAATIPLMLALTWGGQTYPWSSPTILMLVGGSAVVWLLLNWRLRRADEPLIPLDVLRNGVVRNATLGLAIGSGASVAMAVYVPIYLQGHLGLSVAASGFALIPYIFGTTFGAGMTGRRIPRVKNYKLFAVGGLSLAIFSLVLLALLSASASLLATEIMLFAAGAGFGAVFPVGTVSVQNAVDHANLGVATSVLTFMRNLGSAMSVAAIGAIALASGLPIAQEGAAGLAVSGDVTVAFRAIFLLCAGLALVSLVFFARLEAKPLRTTIGGD